MGNGPPTEGFGLHGSTEIYRRSIRHVVNRSGALDDLKQKIGEFLQRNKKILFQPRKGGNGHGKEG